MRRRFLKYSSCKKVAVKVYFLRVMAGNNLAIEVSGKQKMDSNSLAKKSLTNIACWQRVTGFHSWIRTVWDHYDFRQQKVVKCQSRRRKKRPFTLGNNRYQSFQWFWSALRRLRRGAFRPCFRLSSASTALAGLLPPQAPSQSSFCVPFPRVSHGSKGEVWRRRVQFFTLCCEAVGSSHEVHYPPTFCGLHGCLLDKGHGLARCRSRRPRFGWCRVAQNVVGKRGKRGKAEIWTFRSAKLV